MAAKPNTWTLRRTKVCAGGTGTGRLARDPGRPGIVRVEGMVKIVWHPQTKGRETENTNIGLKPCSGRRGYKPEAKFQPMRCQESEWGIVLENEVRTKGFGSQPRAVTPAGSKGQGVGEGPTVGC